MSKRKAPPSPAGARLKQAIHIARARAGINSDMQLALRSGVHYDTFMNWYAGKTRPRGAELQRVATALGVPFLSLEEAYEGREPEPQPLQDAVRDLTGAVRVQTKELHELIERLDTLASAAVAAGVRDALREAGVDPDAGGSPSSRPDGLTA